MPPLARTLLGGALLWGAFALAYVALDGVVMDEAVVAAQVITGAIRYPAGHPHDTLYPSIFSLGYYLAALEWWGWPRPDVIAGTRNVFFLWLSTYTPFALTVVLTERPLLGHVAAALTLSETACSFLGVYPSWVFPAHWSSGHIGTHLGLLAVAWLVAGRVRSGAVLVGLMPGVHAAVAVLLTTWSGLFAWRALARPSVRQAMPMFLAGLLVCAGLAGAIAWRTTGHDPRPPYDRAGDHTTVLETFTRTADPHRRPIDVTSPAHLVSPAALLAFTALLAMAGSPVSRHRARWLAAFGALAWGIVFTTRAWQALAGELPLAVATLMPGRFANLGHLLLVPLALAVIDGTRRGDAAIAILLVVEAVLLAVDRGAPAGTERWLAFHYLVYVVLGVALGRALGTRWPTEQRRTAILASAVVVAASMLAGWHTSHLGILVLGSSLVAGIALDGLAWPKRTDRVIAALCVAVTLTAATGPHLMNRIDGGSERTGPFETALADWLAREAQPGDMLVAPLWPPLLLQGKTGHPVLFEINTMINVLYRPASAVPVAQLARDLYGIDWFRPETLVTMAGPEGFLHPNAGAWSSAWRTRTCEEWLSLGATYGFRLVVSPSSVPLPLEARLRTGHWVLYAVPGDCTPATAN